MPNDDQASINQRASQSYDALWERVDNQGRSIRALAEETATQFRDFRADTSKAISELSTSLKGLDTKLDAQAKSVADQGRPQYAALVGGMLAAVGVAVTIIQWQTGLHDRPVDDKLASLTSSISDLSKNTTGAFADMTKVMVSKDQFVQTIDFENRISELKSQQGDINRNRIQNQIDKVQADEVSRAEHQFHWDQQDKVSAAHEQEIQALSRRLDELAPASDVIKRLSEQEHELELRVFGADGRYPSTPR